jgi:pantoate--beta-alanine ligase
MKIIRSVSLMQKEALGLRKKGMTLGLVPTMGALHSGHLSLIGKARKENDIVVVSVFVNPKQFGPNEDYLRYPRPFSKDRAACAAAGADILFAPGPGEMYPDGYSTYVSVEGLSDDLCGLSRPGHFRGVATIVLKLFNIVRPSKAYFGLKDLQQVRIIEKMVNDLNLSVRIIECPIKRELSGLALSSRNRYLTGTQRAQAAGIAETLQYAGNLIKSKKFRNVGQIVKSARKKIPGSKVDYLEIRDLHTLKPLKTIKLPVVVLAAVWMGKTRLIDNLVVTKEGTHLSDER